MWVWWVLSLLILIACIIFAYRMIVSSYEFLPFDKRYFFKFNKNSNDDQRRSYLNETRNVSLKGVPKSFEDDNTFYQTQFMKFHERLKVIEETLTVQTFSPKISKIEDEEDWKELYYEENATKEKLENELDGLHQRLKEIQSDFKETELEDWKEMYYAENEAKIKIENELEILREKLAEAQSKLGKKYEVDLRLVELQNNYDVSLNDINSLEGSIQLLQRQFSASLERENELENLLISEIIVREKYSMLQSKYTQLQIEANDLQKRIIEQSQKEINLEIRLIHLSELESRLAFCEQEKSKLKSRFENNLMG